MRSFSDHVSLAVVFVLAFAATSFSQTVARVDVTAPTTNIVVGQTIVATAAAKDANGAVIPGATFVWTSGTPAMAAVDASGNVTALAPGAVQIRARTGNITGTLTFNVIPWKVVVTGPTSVQVNSSATLSAAALDINGNAIPNVAMTWASDNTGIATVSAGVVQALSLGEVNISATAANFVGRMTLRVDRPVDYSLETVVSSDPVGGGSTIQSILPCPISMLPGDMAFARISPAPRQR